MSVCSSGNARVQSAGADVQYLDATYRTVVAARLSPCYSRHLCLAAHDEISQHLLSLPRGGVGGWA